MTVLVWIVGIWTVLSGLAAWGMCRWFKRMRGDYDRAPHG